MKCFEKVTNNLIFLFVIIMLLGCTQTKGNEEVFSEMYNTEGELWMPSDMVRDPCMITVFDGHLLLGNYKGVPLLEIYNLSTKEKENEFLNIGNGPNEMLLLGNIQYIPGTKELLAADLFKGKIYSYGLNDAINTDNPIPTKLYDKGENASLMFVKLYKGKDLFIAESRDPKGRILLLNNDGSEKGYYLAYPDKGKIDENLSDIHNAKLYASAVTVNPYLDKVAFVTYSAGMIDICEIGENGVVPLWNYTEFYPQGIMVVPMGDDTAVAHTKESRNGFTSISSSNKYIYALYSGKLQEDPTYASCEEVYVVSWDGKESYKIKLDKSIKKLAVDEKDEYIYGITSLMDIIRFKIPKR